MIKEIQELNFPGYATLSQATVTLQDMAEKTITSQVKIDGAITPDFSYDWEVAFQGEKYIMPLRQPQGAKENTSLNSTIDLTFQHWAIYWLKQKFFFNYVTIEAGTVTPNQFIVPLQLNLKDFCDYLSNVCDYWYGDKITVDLNPKWEYASEPTKIDISYSKVWDVLIKLYELYAVRWVIEPNGDIDNYVIKVGYPTTEINHIFEYGFKGGLLKVERQVQDENIRNMIIGRGGSKNLPYRYFKKHDEDNASFSPDPDWIPELANKPFTELHGATFRSYIQGWKAKHYPAETITTPTADLAYAPWAWLRGYTDVKFNPVEAVADEFDTSENGYGIVKDSSIAKYGELMDGLDNNEDIYPTIQGVEIDGLGRIDEVVFVEQITSDDVQAEASDALSTYLDVAKASSKGEIAADARATIKISSDFFEVPDGASRLEIGALSKSCRGQAFHTLGGNNIYTPVDSMWIITEGVTIIVYDENGKGYSTSGLLKGRYRYEATVKLHNTYEKPLLVTIGYEKAQVITTSPDGVSNWKSKFRIYVKNIWQTQKGFDSNGRPILNETNEQYAERVWRPILGDRENNAAKVVFSDGLLSTSQDYEFTITDIPKYRHTLCEYIDKGGVKRQYYSEWEIVLAKSDADLESLGVYVPNTQKQGAAGDHIYFIGIDMPHMYVVKAEERVDDWKKDELAKVKEIKPTWVVGLDKVRIHNHGEANALIEQLHVGNTFTLFDQRFISGSHQEELYLQSITYNYNEPTETEANLLPDVEVVLSDKYEVSANPVSQLSGEVTSLQKQFGSIGNIEQIVRAVGDRIYLRKDGFPDRSMSPTEFASIISSMGFRSGSVDGTGWGVLRDDNGNTVIEADVFRARKGMEVNSLIINQISVQGGKCIESAAVIEVSHVVETPDGYICLFDQRGGSLVNQFKVDDVAMSEIFDPDLKQLKFYKRRVTEVGADSITLTKGYDPTPLPDGTIDTGVNGSGVPIAGDIITHYGSYDIQSGRTFVKVRDVIGGGNERFLEQLTSVNTDGVEYCFIGRQSGMYNGQPRFFVGGEGSYIEWLDGELHVKGDLSVESTIGGKNIGDFLKDEVADSIEIGGTNLIRNSSVVRTAINKTIYDLSESLVVNQEYTLTEWPHPDDNPNYHSWIVYLLNENDEVLGNMGITKSSPTGRTSVLTFTYSPSEPPLLPPAKIRLKTTRPGTYAGILRIKLEQGNVPTDWSASPFDNMDKSADYLKAALTQGTDISGGLVLTSNIQMGYKDETGNRVTTSGINGIILDDDPNPDKTVAIWAGGEQIDAELNPARGAAMAIRMDGSGYFAKNTVRIKENTMELGDNVRVSSTSFSMANASGVPVFELRAGEVPYNPTTAATTRNIVEEYVKKGVLKYRYQTSQSLNLYAELPKEKYLLPHIDKDAQLSGTVTVKVRTVKASNEELRPLNDTQLTIGLVALNGGSQTELEKWQSSARPIKGTIESTLGNTDTVVYSHTLELSWVNDSAHTDGIALEIGVGPSYTSITPDYTVEVYWDVNFKLSITGSKSQLNMMGINGFSSIWGDARLAVTEQGAVIGFGNKYIRFDNNGIKICRDGTNEVSL